jgi:hypothetical protein
MKMVEERGQDEDATDETDRVPKESASQATDSGSKVQITVGLLIHDEE